MTVTQREYDIAELDAELKMQRSFDEWRTSFLDNRLQNETPLGIEGDLDVINEEEVEDGAVR